jgi:hypothetical protein
MFVSCNSICTRALTVAAILVYANTAWSADEEAVANEDATDEVIEEIVVYGYKSGEKIDLDARYEELFRSRAEIEFAKAKGFDEEYEWRKSIAAVDDSSRIKWGYDPDTEMRMRRDTSLTDLPIDTVKPASLFRVEF